MSDSSKVLSYAGAGLIFFAIALGILGMHYHFNVLGPFILLIGDIGMVLMGCGEAIDDQIKPIWRSIGLIWAIIWSFTIIFLAWAIFSGNSGNDHPSQSRRDRILWILANYDG